MKILYFDTETTGINPKVNEIIQFAAIIEIDGVVKEEVDIRCQPTDWEHIDQSALDVNKVTIEQLKTFDDPSIMATKINALFDKYIDKYDTSDKFYPAGHNVQFDLDFLQAFWNKHISKYGTGSYQNWRSLDSRVFANFLNVSGKLDVPDIKLGTICKHWGIEIDAHDALNDIRAARQVIKKMMSMI